MPRPPPRSWQPTLPGGHPSAVAGQIDDEVKRLLDESERRDRDLMEKHRNKLERLAETLLQEETLARDRIEALLSARGEKAMRTGTSG